jgi:hypothetical protein
MVIANKMNKKLLFNDNYEGSKKEEFQLEQYRIYVEMADRISNRRAISNSFFLGINTVLISLIDYITKFHSPAYLLNISGIFLTILWFNIVRSYKNLNTAKYTIINNIEEKLPLRPYFSEWEMLEKGKNKKKYWPLTHIEILIPIIFTLIYAWPFLNICYSFFYRLCMKYL